MKTVGAGGVTLDAQLAQVVQAMVGRALAAEVPAFGDPAVLPVREVVDVQAALGATTGHPTAAVALLDELAKAIVDRALAGEDVHGRAVAFQHHPAGGIAAQVVLQ